MGAFSGLGMGLNGVLTALLAPWLVPLALRLLA
jgi:putative effector of murein hydrolase